MRSAAVVLAAGSGSRAGGKTPKQFFMLNGEPLFMRSARVFAQLKSIKEIVLVARTHHRARVLARLQRIRFSGKFQVVAGGAFRGASVANGVKAITTHPDVVLIHDAARAMVSADIVRRVEQSAFRHGVSLAAWPLPDTLKQVDERGRVRKTVPRQHLWMAQTPQAFRWNVAQACLLRPSRTATDDVELAQRKGFPVYVVDGAATNFKVTYLSDFQLCQRLSK